MRCHLSRTAEYPGRTAEYPSRTFIIISSIHEYPSKTAEIYISACLSHVIDRSRTTESHVIYRNRTA